MANTYIRIGIGLTGGSDSLKVKVSIDDKNPNFLEDKFDVGSDKLVKTVSDPGVDEKLILDVDQTKIDHDQLLNFEETKHKPLDDSQTSVDTLWSSQKIQDEVDELDTKIFSNTQQIDNNNQQINNNTQQIDNNTQQINNNTQQINENVTTISDNSNFIQNLNNSLSDHINQTESAHEASAVFFDNSTNEFTATEVQSAIEELKNSIGSLEQETLEQDVTFLDAQTDVNSGITLANDIQAVNIEIYIERETNIEYLQVEAVKTAGNVDWNISTTTLGSNTGVSINVVGNEIKYTSTSTGTDAIARIKINGI